MQKQILRLMLSVAVSALLGACNREPQPSVSPVGLWQGTLTTTSSGSRTQTFTAEISEADAEYADYKGVFTIDSESYGITGNFKGKYEVGEFFEFYAPLPELQPTTSPTRPGPGFHWSGVVTATEYAGDWFVVEENLGFSSHGTFKLERLP